MIVHEVFIDPFEYEVYCDEMQFTVHRIMRNSQSFYLEQIGDPVYADRPAYEYSTHSYDEMVARALRQERGKDL